MKNDKRTLIARIAVAAIGIITVACMVLILAALLSGCASGQVVSRDVLDLDIDPERQTITRTYPQKYWMFYRANYTDGTCDYYWEEISREEYAKIKEARHVRP